MGNAVLTRVVRREMHSPRTAIAVIVLTLVAIAAVYAGTELVLHLLGAKPLLVSPGEATTWLVNLPGDEGSTMIAAGAAVAAAIGLVLIGLAVAPGMRSRHQLGAAAHAVVVDNGVVASAVAERVRRELDLARDGAVVGIGHRSADVTVRPEPGHTVNSSQVRAVAEAALADYGLRPAVRVRARVQSRTHQGGAE
ncbi:DNA/RNA endonuclease G [Leucobacter albus]|uniref:DNA/RNA endonuclease G n=1 Tax=Leucobacter albus TaxID=272210 RepID=A0ABW3TNE5_9MICO